MSEPIPVEQIAAIRTLFFERLADANDGLFRLSTEIAVHIGEQRHNTILAILADAESRIEAMRTILIVFRECLEG